jgi:hypothetical protein
MNENQGVLRFVRIRTTGESASEFVDETVDGESRHIVDGVPPLDIVGPFDVSEMMLVVGSGDARDWVLHVAPHRHWIIILSGRVAVTVTDGERREFGPGDVVLDEDTSGRGHLTTPLTDDFRFALIAVAP